MECNRCGHKIIGQVPKPFFIVILTKNGRNRGSTSANCSSDSPTHRCGLFEQAKPDKPRFGSFCWKIAIQQGLYKLTNDESLQLVEEVLAMVESKRELDVESPF